MSTRIGLRDVYYAELTQDTDLGVVYNAPVRIIGAVTANVNPNASTETLFADDGPMIVASTLGEIELELVMAHLPITVLAALLGHNTIGNKLVRAADDIPPWLALGFRALKANGNYRYVWLLKGKFMVPEEAHETKGDTIDFQTPTITGSFVRRDFDDNYQYLQDEDDGAVVDWFSTGTLA